MPTDSLVPFVTRRCMFCGERSMVSVEPAKLARWQSGEPIQRVWLDKSAEWRDMLGTGTHDWCWGKYVACEEEEEKCQ